MKIKKMKNQTFLSHRSNWSQDYRISVRERQISYDFTHMWNLRNKTDEHRGGKEKIKEDEIKRRQIIKDS